MTEYVLSMDPGISTGIALIRYEPDSAPELVGAWQFTGGVNGLLHFWRIVSEFRYDYEALNFGDFYNPVERRLLTIIAEKFTARNTKGFAYTTAALEPLRGEGALIALGLMPDYDPKEKRWRDPGLQYLVGGADLADKKKRQHAFLKDIGFYRTNKDFPESPAKDGADDFRSAAAHGLNYIARVVKHKPTFELIQDWIERNS